MACYNSLKMNRKMAIQAPAKDNYCPNFLHAIRGVKEDKSTKSIFACFTPPWFFRNTAEEYAELFTRVGFKVEYSKIIEVISNHTTEEAYKIFESGAAAGYLNQAYYSTQLSQEYIDAFRSIVRSSLENREDETKQLRLTFYRIYILAIKK